MNQHESMMLEDLDPRIVWQIFFEISKIPRKSKHEEKIRNWIKEWASNHEISWKEDSTGNLLLIKEASPGCDHYPGVIMQGHLDMVAQKLPSSKHDFNSDPIPIQRTSNYITADGTTLGADNGIGVAMALAVLIDPEIQHGPLEVLLTVDEESGLTGAFGLEKGFLSYKLLLNLDSEDEGEITISSAGGGDTQISIPLSVREYDEYISYQIEVKGLIGGHSGVDIHQSRINAIKLLVEILEELSNLNDLVISQINGGSAHNAIPRDSSANILIPKSDETALQKMMTEFSKKIPQMKENEPSLDISYTQSEGTFGIEKSKEIIEVLTNLPHGPLTYSKTIPDLVESSNNLAIVKTTKNSLEIQISTRSSVDSELTRIRKDISTLAKRYKGEVLLKPSYPGWEPDLDSPFLKLVHQEYEREYGKKVKLKAIHAGLETGLFKGLDPELHCVSIGPEIKDPHSPSERVIIDSVGLIWRILLSTLEKIHSIQDKL
ncbi:MAG: beta-Ala-His dipeptidase [Candidatus Hodarchaeales archaeon]|jgi:dipeptidase D